MTVNIIYIYIYFTLALSRALAHVHTNENSPYISSQVMPEKSLNTPYYSLNSALIGSE